ncbi:MAG: glycosyltransferase, partial [Candidatus Omnitrophica bacterium]|nr:glycosyltransferase [Candidatus Omnitrophota bacterium]
MRNNYPKVSLITVNFNGKKHLKRLFDSLFRLIYPKNKLEVIFVDNVSTDNSVKFVKKNYPKVRIIKNDVNNYCKAVNLGIVASKAEYIVLVNNDTRVSKTWLTELIKVISKDKKIAAVGSKVLTMSGRIQNVAHYELPNFYWGERGAGQENKRYNTFEEVSSLCGASVLYRKDALSEVGLFDEDFVIYAEDVDMSFRLKQKGYKLIFVPTSIIYHKFHGTASEELARYYIERNRLLFLAKHYPHKLSSSLIGSGYFTAKRSVNSHGKIYSLFPEIITKLMRTHSSNIVNEVMSELFGEINKIVNYENELLIKKFNEMAEDQKEANVSMTRANEELKQKIKEIVQKDKELSDKENKITEDRNNTYTHLNNVLKESQKKVNELNERDKELTLFRDKLTDLSRQFKSQSEELSKKLKIISEREKELQQRHKDIGQKDKELTDLSRQFKSQSEELSQKLKIISER